MTGTDGAIRRWEVDNSWLVDKYEAIDDSELVDEHAPGRIVLIACSVDGSNDLGFNVIVSGHLVDEQLPEAESEAQPQPGGENV